MLNNWEESFSNWKNPPSDSEEERIRQTVRSVKAALDADYNLSGRDIRVFENGSYRNNTNVRLNSDIDICVMLNDIFYFDLPENTTREQFGLNSPSSYTFDEFKNSVETALKNHFGTDASRGNKSIKIRPNTNRINADVVPCFKLNRYTGGLAGYGNHRIHTGIKFFADDGIKVENFPDQHYANGVNKNLASSTRFKQVARILKQLNYKMEEDGIEISSRIPSFLLECLVWNVPNNILTSQNEYTLTVRGVLEYLYSHTHNEQLSADWVEVSELLYLFKGHDKWTKADVKQFTEEAWRFLNF